LTKGLILKKRLQTLVFMEFIVKEMGRWKFHCLQDKQKSNQNDKTSQQTCLFSKIPLDERFYISTIVDSFAQAIYYGAR